MNLPNVVFVFADQLRAQALGYAGDPNVNTPCIDKMTEKSIIFDNAISSCPVCSPTRASLLTGLNPLSHGVFLNDVHLANTGNSIADAFKSAGYHTAYIGKWHVDGSGSRSAFIPKEHRQGFDYWKVLECTHDYNHSRYYANDDHTIRTWEGYDTIAQTQDAINYIQKQDQQHPFFMMLSWGTPHEPYFTAPERFQKIYHKKKIQLRPNVPRRWRKRARKDLKGYYSHISAMDESLGQVFEALQQKKILKNTIFVFWSDHGDMHYSHGLKKKQKPWEESIHVPLFIHAPSIFPEEYRKKHIQIPISPADLMPTLLGFCNLPDPRGIEGDNLAPRIRQILADSSTNQENDILIASYSPFADFGKSRGGKEYRGIRTLRYTYVKTLEGPWLLYDNQNDPYQQHNLCNHPEFSEIQKDLETRLQKKLKEQNDEFLPAEAYLKKWNYQVDKSGAVPYTN